jgi:hypothetical protein
LKLKLDENLGHRVAGLIRQAGHDVSTVFEQNLAGADDPVLIRQCRAESRALVTLDLDFANPLVFPPWEYRGIAVFRLPRHPTRGDFDRAAKVFMSALATEKLDGKLWIVESTRIRLYRPDREEED